jgi:hypothetical protein
MALATTQLVTFHDAGSGLDIVVTLEYDNVGMFATRVICVNPTQNSCFAEVTNDANGDNFSRTFGPGTTSISLPTSPPSKRVAVTFNSRGTLNGYTFGGRYPA